LCSHHQLEFAAPGTLSHFPPGSGRSGRSTPMKKSRAKAHFARPSVERLEERRSPTHLWNVPLTPFGLSGALVGRSPDLPAAPRSSAINAPRKESERGTPDDSAELRRLLERSGFGATAVVSTKGSQTGNGQAETATRQTAGNDLFDPFRVETDE